MSDELEYQSGHDYGVGLYSVSGAVRGDAVKRSEPEDVIGASGQKVKFFMEQVETTESLTKSLSASADASARYGLFNASASFRFAESMSMNQYSLFLLVSSTVHNSFRQMRDVRMNKEAIELWSSGDIKAFHRRFGDSYVSGIGTGGFRCSVLEIVTSSREEKKEISAKLKGGYNSGVAKYNMKAQFQNAVEAISETNSLKVRHLQIGGSDVDVEVSAGGIVTKAVNFAETVAGDKAAPFVVMTKKYETVSNLPAMPNRFDYQLARDVIRSCGTLRLRYLDWINDIDYVMAHPQQFKWTNEREQAKALDQKADELREAVSGLARQASMCADDVNKCDLPSGSLTVALSPDLLPERKPKPKRKRHSRGKNAKKKTGKGKKPANKGKTPGQTTNSRRANPKPGATKKPKRPKNTGANGRPSNRPGPIAVGN